MVTLNKLNTDMISEKTCTGECKRLLPLSEFYFQNKATGRREARCKTCKSEYQKKNSKRFYQRDLAKECTYPPIKECTKCKHERPIEDFWLKSEVNGRRDAECRYCRIEYRGTRKDEIKETHDEWYYNGGGQEWHKQYEEEYKPRRNARNKERRQEDPNYQIRCNVRTRIYDCLRKQNIRADKKIEYLGMDSQLYNLYLEALFEDGMKMKITKNMKKSTLNTMEKHTLSTKKLAGY